MEGEQPARLQRAWSRRKKDDAPRGIRRHPSGGWAIRYTCGAGCLHKEKVGALKNDATRLYHERRNRARSEPGWCPVVDTRQARQRVQAAEARERARVTFASYATDDYRPWARKQHRSAATTESQVMRLVGEFGALKLDEVTTAVVERFLNKLEDRVSAATVNRYRDRLSGMFKRAMRLGLVTNNPVTGIPKLKESSGRVAYLTAADEQAVHDALPVELRALFTVSVHTGLRWSEQVGLTWANVDLHAGAITVRHSKNGGSRHVPINSVVRSVLFDLSLHREHIDDPSVRVFACRHAQADKFFPKAVNAAQEALRAAGVAAGGLDGYTWHGNRHTFASRLIMAGVDQRTVQELGGWKSLKMVQRYSHLAPGHLHDAVERLAVPYPGSAARTSP
jgi:integrase